MIISLILFLTGIFLIFIYDDRKLRVSISFAERMRVLSEMEMDLDLEMEEMAKAKRMNFYRYIALIALLLLSLRKGIAAVMVVIFLGILTTPRRDIMGVASPVKRALDSIKEKKILEYDKEIFQGAGTIKTLALLNSKGTFSADYIYEKLAEQSFKLRKIYSSFLVLYRGGNTKEAFDYFRKTVNTNTGKQFAILLEKLEYLSPKEMVSQIEGFQESIAEERMTRQTSEIDRNSVITTLASTACIFTIILNFAVVGIFMDSLKMLSGIF
ncbi:MAG: hypothetical protein MJ146_03275 [Clostridia bacterium]|nr:hypothetical protein [Clostridia bacterium]